VSDQYPPAWDMTPPPDRLDPRLGSMLDPISPTAAEEALVAELVYQYVARSHDFAETFRLSGPTVTPISVGPACSWRCWSSSPPPRSAPRASD
jgi:hypothetical protein